MRDVSIWGKDSLNVIADTCPIFLPTRRTPDAQHYPLTLDSVCSLFR